MTLKEAKKIIEVLTKSSKRVTPVGHKPYTLTKSVSLGRVLQLIDDKVGGRNERTRGLSYNQELIELWQPLDLDHSLQKIIRDTEVWIGDIIKVKNGHWEIKRKDDILSTHSMRSSAERIIDNLWNNNQEVFKDENITNLFNFLKTIFIN